MKQWAYLEIWPNMVRSFLRIVVFCVAAERRPNGFGRVLSVNQVTPDDANVTKSVVLTRWLLIRRSAWRMAVGQNLKFNSGSYFC